uniref:Protein TIC 40, chloroplastic n=1 Tax=Kalanchoe fedtschenkoi TaxID=63787 RepID=A0A7N0U740_KALFE
MDTLPLISSTKLSVGSNSVLNSRDLVLLRPHQSSVLLKKSGPASNVPAARRFRVACSASGRSVRLPNGVPKKFAADKFASVSTSSTSETTSVGVSPQYPVPPPQSQFGSPLFWIGVGVGLSALFSWGTTKLKNYAMQQAFKTMMGQMDPQNKQFGQTPFPAGSPFPFPPPQVSPPPPVSPSTGTYRPAASQPAVTLDVSATKVEVAPPADVTDETEEVKETSKFAFVDISQEETLERNPFESSKDVAETSTSQNAPFASEVTQNGATSQSSTTASDNSQFTAGKPFAGMSVEALEKMMEDPTVQKMVYPYLPEEMRNPTTFKWMLQNPQYRQQLEEMLNNMSGSSEWDSRMMDTLKNFDLSSPEVKQQFDQIGLTPEEVISKIMANPDVAMAFQNPRVQAAIMDCSQNPLSITKYQNDREVMDVFNKISELFPGVAGL